MHTVKWWRKNWWKGNQWLKICIFISFGFSWVGSIFLQWRLISNVRNQLIWVNAALSLVTPLEMCYWMSFQWCRAFYRQFSDDEHSNGEDEKQIYRIIEIASHATVYVSMISEMEKTHREKRNHIVSRMFYLASILPWIDATDSIWDFGIFGMRLDEKKIIPTTISSETQIKWDRQKSALKFICDEYTNSRKLLLHVQSKMNRYVNYFTWIHKYSVCVQRARYKYTQTHTHFTSAMMRARHSQLTHKIIEPEQRTIEMYFFFFF